MLESKIQTKIKKKLEAEGWLVIKLIRTSLNGVPDLMCLKNGKAMFIEVKQESGKVSEIQKLRIKQLREQGFEVKIWTDYGHNYSKEH
jgi:Holliday junction resolvase